MIRSFLKNESGGSFVEIALTVPFFVIPLLLGIIDFARLSQAQLAISEAAHSAVIDASIYSSIPGKTQQDVISRMQKVATDNVQDTVGLTSDGKSAHLVSTEHLYCVCYLTYTQSLGDPCMKGQTTYKCSGSGDHIVYFAKEQVYYQFYPMFPQLLKLAGAKYDPAYPGSLKLYRISFLQIAD